jgi:hypothetical protein
MMLLVPVKQRTLRILLWILFGGLVLLAMLDFYRSVIDIGGMPFLGSKRSRLFIFAVIPALVLLWSYGLWLVSSGILPRFMQRVLAFVPNWPLWLRVCLAPVLLGLPAYLFIYSPFGLYYIGFWFRVLALFACSAGCMALLFKKLTAMQWLLYFSAAAALISAVFVAGDWLKEVTNYPFSLSWSEGNRFWDYSLMFGSNRYIFPEKSSPFTFITPGRQLLWAMAFLIPNLSLQGMRLWDALLWILPGLAFGWVAAVSWPIQKSAWIWKLGFAIWAFLFLSQGPIYAPLLISAILVILAVRRKRLIFSMLLVILAAYYAYYSRWTWIYAPGLWAGILSLLEIKAPSLRPGRWKELARPVILGLSGYFGGQFLPLLITWAGTVSMQYQPLKPGLILNPTANLSRQPLLWDRLLPNPTYPPGILPGALWAGLAVVVLLFWLRQSKLWTPNLLQIVAISIPALAFLSVGIVASVKIGGGSNLHNLDMFWVTLVLVCAWAGRQVFSQPFESITQRNVLLALISMSLILPATYNLQSGSPMVLPEKQAVDKSLSGIQRLVYPAAKQGEVLFVDQRQLLTFGYLQNITLITDYEKKYMMDRAMEGNPANFQSFYKDLANHRFVMILSEPLGTYNIMPNEVFDNEGDAFVRWVSLPVLCYYYPLITFDKVGVQLLVPRSETATNSPIPCPAN